MSEKRFIQEFLDTAGCGGQSDYPFIRKSFYEHQESDEFYAVLEKAVQEAEKIRIQDYTPLEECVMYYYEMELLGKEPKSNLYIKIRQEYQKYCNRQISAFSYYLFLVQTALDNKIQASEKIYRNIYEIYKNLCLKYNFLRKMSYWDNYDAVESEYTKNDEEEKKKMQIRNRDIKSQIRRIQSSIQGNALIVPFASNRHFLDDCTKYILYYALKFLVREELYNLYPEKNRSKQHKLISWLNIFFHDKGTYSFSETSGWQENSPAYDKNAFLKEYFFPKNNCIVKQIEKNRKKAIYLAGKKLILDHQELLSKEDYSYVSKEESLFFFIVTKNIEEFPEQLHEIEKDKDKKEFFDESFEIVLDGSEKILTDLDKAYMYFNDVTGTDEEVDCQKEENQKNKKKGKI